MMNKLASLKLSRLSLPEKILAGGVAGVGAFLVWSFWSKKANADVLPPVQPSTPSAPLQPLPSPYPVISSGASAYVVTTQTDPLNVRQGPGVSYPILGSLAKGSTVSSTGGVSKNPVDGMSWTQVMNPQGAVIGWATLTYLTAGGQPVVTG